MPPAAAGRPASLPPADVAGGIVLGERPESGSEGTPSAGFATAAGILTGRPTLRPTRTEVRPDIDGRLDDLVWRNALRVTEFVQESPLEGAPATEDTEVWISYDSQNLYVAVHAHYEDPGIMRATRVDRDQSWRDDNITVYFDPFLDQQRAYALSVNGYNVQGDEIINARGRSGRGGGGGRRGGGGGGGGGGFRRSGIPFGDRSWDALFDSGAQIVDDGFTAEMAIPFKSLRYPQRGRGVPHRWAFQIVREIRHKDENAVWAPISRGVAGFLPQMGLLEGMSNLSMSRNLEIMPVATRSPARLARQVDRRLPAREGAAGRGRQRQVRHHVEPDRRLHAQPGLLADRVRPPADRDQPAVRALLPGAAAVLSRGRRDLQRVRADQLRPHADHPRPGLGREDHRQGGSHVGRLPGDERRGGRFRGRPRRARRRRRRERRDRAGALRPLRRVAHRRDGDQPRLPRRLQPHGAGRRRLPAWPDAVGRVHRGAGGQPRSRRGGLARHAVRRQLPAAGAATGTSSTAPICCRRTSGPTWGSCSAPTSSATSRPSATASGPRAGSSTGGPASPTAAIGTSTTCSRTSSSRPA